MQQLKSELMSCDQARAAGFVYMMNFKNWGRRCAHSSAKGPMVGLQSLEAVGGDGEASPQTDCLFNRQKLAAEMADSSNLIKPEDDRIVGDLKLMKRYYANLFALHSVVYWGVHQAVQQPQGAAKCAQEGEPDDTASSVINDRKC